MLKKTWSFYQRISCNAVLTLLGRSTVHNLEKTLGAARVIPYSMTYVPVGRCLYQTDKHYRQPRFRMVQNI